MPDKTEIAGAPNYYSAIHWDASVRGCSDGTLARVEIHAMCRRVCSLTGLC